MNYRPMGRRIVVRVVEQKEVEIAGNKLSIAKGLNRYGKREKEWDVESMRVEVIRTGADVTTVEERDIVVIPGAAGRWMDFDIHGSTDTHRIIDEDDILAIEEYDKEAIHV